jgi:glycerol dehydrogenase-like iron-containing ADH family enzyme
MAEFKMTEGSLFGSPFLLAVVFSCGTVLGLLLGSIQSISMRNRVHEEFRRELEAMIECGTTMTAVTFQEPQRSREHSSSVVSVAGV